MSDNKLEAACALAFTGSMREQGTHIRTADASQLSIAFEAAAQAVVKHYMIALTGCDDFQTGTLTVAPDARGAVIEAAEAWIDRRDGPTDEQLRLTVAALQEVRDE